MPTTRRTCPPTTAGRRERPGSRDRWHRPARWHLRPRRASSASVVPDLPDVLHPPAPVGIASELHPAIDLLGAELDRDLPGTSAAAPALLDLLPLYVLRAWFEAPRAPSGWARASCDPN
jgi:hypothetical protein